MTKMKLGLQHASRLRHEAPTHLFSIGQSVQLKGRIAGSRSPGAVFQVTGTLPPKENSPQYRIRSENEVYERVTTQDDIEAITIPSSSAALLERTFGHG